MRLKDIVRAPKTNISLGNWSSGRVKRKQFPLSKAKPKAYKFGQAYDWSVIPFDALDNQFRVLILFRSGREIYRATLGMLVKEDVKVLCSYEYHGTEPGWHCHAVCENFDSVPFGVMRGPWDVRLPAANRFHRRNKFDVTKAHAKEVAQKFFGIDEPGPLL